MCDNLEKDIISYETQLRDLMDKFFAARQGLSRTKEQEKCFEGGFRLAWQTRTSELVAPEITGEQLRLAAEKVGWILSIDASETMAAELSAPEICTWKWQDNNYFSECRRIMFGVYKDSEYKYCPYCGKLVSK